MSTIPSNNKTSARSKKTKIDTKDADNLLRHLAFDNTAQANIIFTVSSGKVILANNTAAQLLGYSKKEIVKQSWARIFNTKDKGFSDILKQRKIDGSGAGLATVIKKNGQRIRCVITSALFLDNAGITKSITTITDISQDILNQKNIDIENRRIVTDNINVAKAKQKVIDIKNKKIVADNILLVKSTQKGIDNKNKKLVADNISIAKSKQKVIDIKKQKIVANNILLVRSTQKGIDNKNRKLVADNISIAKSKQKVIDIKKEKIVADNILLVRSTQKGIDNKNRKLVANNISIAKAKQKTIDTKNKKTVADDIIIAKAKASAVLAATNLWKKHTGKSSYDVMWDWNISSGEIYVGNSVKEVFGYSVLNNIIAFKDFLNCLLPAEKENVRKKILLSIASKSKSWKDTFMFKCQNGALAFAVSRAVIIRNKRGKAVRLIGAIHDMTKLEELKIKLKDQQVWHKKATATALEEKLDFEIRLKEKQIADAMEDAKDTERADIGKELHDNINQLLGASRMYLEMAKSGGKNSKMYLARSSKYMLNAIEEIRKLTKGLTTDIIKNLGLCVAIENIIEEVMEINPVKISSNIENFNEDGMNDKFKLNIFRILQEQLNNIVKHAHAKAVRVDLSKNKKGIVLRIADDGVGFDILKKQSGIGIANIKSRAANFNGKANFISTPSHGCALTATFPISSMQSG